MEFFNPWRADNPQPQEPQRRLTHGRRSAAWLIVGFCLLLETSAGVAAEEEIRQHIAESRTLFDSPQLDLWDDLALAVIENQES